MIVTLRLYGSKPDEISSEVSILYGKESKSPFDIVLRGFKMLQLQGKSIVYNAYWPQVTSQGPLSLECASWSSTASSSSTSTRGGRCFNCWSTCCRRQLSNGHFVFEEIFLGLYRLQR